MNTLSPVSLAYFGKIASRGDFVRSAQQGALTQMLDQWLSQGLDLLSTDPRWKQLYDQVPPLRFAFLGVRSQVGLAGHLVPSLDASGRRFPFVTAGSFEVAAPLALMAHAPLALDRLWSRLESLGRDACATQDATALLGDASHTPLQIDTHPGAYASRMDDFLAAQTVGTLQDLLRLSHAQLDLRRALLALGMLLQPVPASGVSRLDTGLALPLPDDALQVPVVAAFWLSLVTPFLARGDFELTLFLLRRQTDGSRELCIGFAGGSPATLQAVFNSDKRAEAFVEVAQAHWVDAHTDDDYAIKKLSSYLMQPQLSMRQAVQTFKQCFLGE